MILCGWVCAATIVKPYKQNSTKSYTNFSTVWMTTINNKCNNNIIKKGSIKN